jgi:hypothetical protein
LTRQRQYLLPLYRRSSASELSETVSPSGVFGERYVEAGPADVSAGISQITHHWPNNKSTFSIQDCTS